MKTAKKKKVVALIKILAINARLKIVYDYRPISIDQGMDVICIMIYLKKDVYQSGKLQGCNHFQKTFTFLGSHASIQTQNR